jgi:RNA polymerase sigma factor (sigma-70 family)
MIFRGDPQRLRRFREGDPAVMEEVYWAYVDKVAGIVRFGFTAPGSAARVPGVAGRADEAAELVQEIFARVFARSCRLGFDGLRDFGPYLFAIARNTLADWARRRGREVPSGWLESTAAELPDPLPEEEAPWADPDTVALVQTYLKGLPPLERAVHEALYVKGLSQRTAAETLGLTRQKLRTLEGHLRTGLRKLIKRRALTSER